MGTPGENVIAGFGLVPSGAADAPTGTFLPPLALSPVDEGFYRWFDEPDDLVYASFWCRSHGNQG